MKLALALLVAPALVLILLTTPLATAAVGPAYAGLGEHVQDGVLCSSIAVVTLWHRDGVESTWLTPGVTPGWFFSAVDRRCVGEFANFLDRECAYDPERTLRCWSGSATSWRSLTLTPSGDVAFERQGGAATGTVVGSLVAAG